MKRIILLLSAISISVSYAATIERYPLVVDSKLLDKIPKVVKENSVWITNTKLDDKNNITEFQTKYLDIDSGVSILYVIPMSSDIQSFYNNWGEHYDACKIEFIKFEIDGEKFKDNQTFFSSGKIWNEDSRYFDLGKGLEKDTSGNYFYIIPPNALDQNLDSNKNLKITSDSTQDAFIPFTNAKAQILKTQNECIEHLQTEKKKLISKIAAEKAKREKEIKQRNAEIDRQNAEVQKRIAAQMKKPDVQIGMTRQQVIKNTRWGSPMKINSTRTKYGTSEQWVYWGYKYLYFENGKLVAIQE